LVAIERDASVVPLTRLAILLALVPPASASAKFAFFQMPSVAQRPFHLQIEHPGLRCRNRGGHGFLLSRQHSYRF
jgi:hypothetical protein